MEFGKKFKTIGFDINQSRVVELCDGIDSTLECSSDELKEALTLSYSASTEDLKKCNVYIVTVPTPIDEHKQPDLTPLVKASEMLGKVVSKGDVIIYESTVYPGATEEMCIPVVERVSGFTFNKDFYAGYSPERINPGDKEHRVTNILKVTSGSTPEIGKKVDALYASIITAGTHLAPTIKVAEAAKVIENAQRDINIAFVNELAKIFNKLDIDTHDVLEAAGTKWNFLPFKPGLVGGHCIGVDPYYLAQKAQEVGYHPEIILAGRRINDSMGEFVATEVLKLVAQNNIEVKTAKVLMLGITFKENCPDIRNTKAIDVFSNLQSFNMSVDVYDPWADKAEVKQIYNIDLVEEISATYDVIIHVVSHKSFQELDLNLIKKEHTVVYDVKGSLNSIEIDKRL